MKRDYAGGVWKGTAILLLFGLVSATPVETGAAPSSVQERPQEPRAPVPTPPPRNPIPRDSIPRDSGPRAMTIEGSIIVQTPRQPDGIIEIRLEGQGSERIGFAYTDGSGRFAFRNVQLQSGSVYYVVVEAEGFQPYRERLDRHIDLRFGGRVMIVLNPVAPQPVPGDPGGSSAYVVDLRTLAANIPEEAVEEYEKAIEESADGNSERSIEHLSRALELAPDYAEAHNSLGAQYSLAARYDEARAEFEKARELNPPWVVPVINLGTLYYQEGEVRDIEGRTEEARDLYRQAVETLEGAITMDRISPTAHYFLGVALYKTSEYPRAESMLNRAIELNGDLDEAFLALINVFSRQGRYQEALEVVTTYLERNPDDPRTPSLENVREQLASILASR